jgi:hypothetical protein
VVHEAGCPDLGPVCEVREEPPHLHDQRLHLLQFSLRGEVRLPRGFGLRLEAPFRVVQSRVQYRRLNGVLFEPSWEDIHHRDETLAGPGDPLLLVGWGTRLGAGPAAVNLSLRAGASMPLGRTEPNPFEAALRGEGHQHVQFGAGTVMPAVDLSVGGALLGLRAALSARALLGVAENRHGFRPGHKFSAGVVLSRELAPGTQGGLLVDAWAERPERWDGQVHEEGNLGRSDLLVGAMFARRIGGVPLVFAVRVPVWTRSVGSEVTWPVLLEVSAAGAAGAAR